MASPTDKEEPTFPRFQHMATGKKIKDDFL